MDNLGAAYGVLLNASELRDTLVREDERKQARRPNLSAMR
jgi:hypothetical protein